MKNSHIKGLGAGITTYLLFEAATRWTSATKYLSPRQLRAIGALAGVAIGVATYRHARFYEPDRVFQAAIIGPTPKIDPRQQKGIREWLVRDGEPARYDLVFLTTTNVEEVEERCRARSRQNKLPRIGLVWVESTFRVDGQNASERVEEVRRRIGKAIGRLDPKVPLYHMHVACARWLQIQHHTSLRTPKELNRLMAHVRAACEKTNRSRQEADATRATHS